MFLVPHEEPSPLNDDQQEAADLRYKYEFEAEENVASFTDEPPVMHNEFPDSEDEEYEADSPFHPKNSIPRGSGNLFKGQQFFSAAAFKEAVLNHALKGGRNIKQVRWDKTKCAFNCVGGNCNWRVYCSVRKGGVMWEVKIYNGVHSCVPNGECEMLMVTAIARLFVNKIRIEPEYFRNEQKEESLVKKN